MKTNYAVGHEAETVAAGYLKKQKYKILDLNWKTRYCEIDIIAQKGKTIHFIEVKYRKTPDQGSGLEYITDRKLQQMRFAAEFWVSEHEWRHNYCLGAIEVSGAGFQITQFVPVIS